MKRSRITEKIKFNINKWIVRGTDLRNKWLIASRSQRTLNHCCVQNTWWSARSIQKGTHRHNKAANSNNGNNTSFTLLFFIHKCVFFLHYFIYRASTSSVAVCVCVCVCLCFASYLMVLVGVRAARSGYHTHTHISVCYALDFACAFWYSVVLILLFVGTCLSR